MANEATVSASLRFAKGGTDITFGKGGFQFTVTGTRHFWGRQLVGNSEEALILGDVGTPGMMIVTNHHATNIVYLRRATAEQDFIEIKPGDIQMFRLKATAPFVITSADTAEIEYVLLPN